jgi:hypothetical protein
VSGIDTVGHRTTLTFPPGTWDNAAPFQLVDEEWISIDLGMIVHGRYIDSRTGEIEYRLTNIRRSDPPSRLFEIPADYTWRDVTTADDQDDPWMSFTGRARYARDALTK